MGDPEYVAVDWRVPLSIADYVQSFLVDMPNAYYMGPGKQWLWFLTRDIGLIELVCDFSAMSKRDIDDYISGALEMLRNE